MDTHQLMQCLWKDACTRHHFGDVLAADMLPTIPVAPHQNIYIVNTDVQTRPGQHWVLFYLPPNSPGEFFDSLGKDLVDYDPGLRNFMWNNRNTYSYNAQRLQGDGSSTCGPFCLYYAVHRCRGVTQSDIINSFTDNYVGNDIKVSKFVNNYF